MNPNMITDMECETNYQHSIFVNIITPIDIINAPLLLGVNFLTDVQISSSTFTLHIQLKGCVGKGESESVYIVLKYLIIRIVNTYYVNRLHTYLCKFPFTWIAPSTDVPPVLMRA